MNPYLEQHILNADPLGLVVLLYQTAICSVRKAKVHFDNGRIAERERSISTTYAILGELVTSLNQEAAPELAGNLRGLYCYMQERLLMAIQRKTDEPLSEVLEILVTLEEAWRRIQTPNPKRDVPTRIVDPIERNTMQMTQFQEFSVSA